MSESLDDIRDAPEFKQAPPLPLRREIPPAEKFPDESLGEKLQPVVAALHDVVQAPIAICAHSLVSSVPSDTFLSLYLRICFFS